VRGGSKESLRGVDFAVTQPGTNTLELMHCSVPFLAPFRFLPFAIFRCRASPERWRRFRWSAQRCVKPSSSEGASVPGSGVPNRLAGLKSSTK
jgi:hypothetical protein